MKNHLLTFILLFSFFQANAQRIDDQGENLDNPQRTYKISPGDTYMQTYRRGQLSNTLQIRTRRRLSFSQIARASLPFLAGTAYGIFGGKLKSSGQELNRASSIVVPSIIGGAAISGASFALRSTKKASVNLTYRNAIGQVIHTENRLIKTGRKTDITLWRYLYKSVDVSVTAPSDQGISVQQTTKRIVSPDSSDHSGDAETSYDCRTGNCPPSDYDDNYNDYLGSIANPFRYYGFYNQYADQTLTYVGGDTFYYSGTGASGAGYYEDPSFTDQGGAGYYPINNGGPVNGPGLYPANRQAEVYQFMWNNQAAHNKEQVALLTDKGVFVLPDTRNDRVTGHVYGHPGINIQQGYNGQKMFIYKGVEYRVQGIMHTHPNPTASYGLSDDDANLASEFKAPIFGITNNGIFRIRSGGSRPGDNLETNYRNIFNSSYTISNAYGYF